MIFVISFHNRYVFFCMFVYYCCLYIETRYMNKTLVILINILNGTTPSFLTIAKIFWVILVKIIALLIQKIRMTIKLSEFAKLIFWYEMEAIKRMVNMRKIHLSTFCWHKNRFKWFTEALKSINKNIGNLWQWVMSI